MKRSHILLFTANAYRTGLLVPVLSLVLLSRGATMETKYWAGAGFYHWGPSRICGPYL